MIAQLLKSIKGQQHINSALWVKFFLMNGISKHRLLNKKSIVEQAKKENKSIKRRTHP